MSFNSVKNKILLPFILVTAIVIVILSVYVGEKIYIAMDELAYKDGTELANYMLDNIDARRFNLELATVNLSQSPLLDKYLNENDINKLYEVLLKSKVTFRVDDILIYGEDPNNPIVSLKETDISYGELAPLVKMGLSGITTSEVRIHNDGAVIYAVAPLKKITSNRKQQSHGAVINSLHITQKVLERMRSSYRLELNFAHKNRVVTSTLSKGDLAQISPGQLAMNGSQIKLGSGYYMNIVRGIDEDGSFSVLVSSNDIGRTTQEIIIVTFTALLMAIGILFIVGGAIARKITEPLAEITEATKAYSNGDFTKKLSITGNDELAKLSRDINLMAEKIKSRIEETEYLANIDGLTNLYNHRYFQQKLDQLFFEAKEASVNLTLIMVDIDHFKKYNDQYGHDQGDILLKQVAALIQPLFRDQDIVARYGGEEFGIIMPGVTKEEAIELGERLRLVIADYPFKGRENQPGERVTVSIGVANYPAHASDRNELFRFADEALYKAKNTSKNRVVLYYSVLDELKGRLNESDQELVQTIRTLITVINSKDRYTLGHSERVLKLVSLMGEALGLMEQDLRDLRIGAFLHDIGKIEIADTILNKELPLTYQEMECLRSHPVVGSEIISPLESLKSVVSIVRHHHERFDGTGYPCRLKGEEIPILARILTIVDSYDAMTTKRPYQSTKTLPEAIVELRKYSGVMFDPHLVEIFINILERTEVHDELA